MIKRHNGGRGRKSSSKHQNFSISLAPHLKEALDAAVTEEVSRSEVIAGLIEAHLLKAAPPGVASSSQSSTREEIN